MSLPKVAVLGRPNVGKSTLFNRLAGRRISIVDPTPGVTRDRLSVFCTGDKTTFELVDTGGYGMEDLDILGESVKTHVLSMLSEADLALFLVDVQTGLTPLDKQMADLLRRREGPVIIVANKADDRKHWLGVHEFQQLGLGEPLCVSALHGYGIADLIEAIEEYLPATEEQAPDQQMEFAVVGPRNAGKSTFINTLVKQDRLIVSEHPGTTRDSVDVRFELDGKPVIAIDTAGVRRKKNMRDSIEFYSSMRSERSIRRADCVLLVIDATQHIGQVTKKLAGYIAEQYKPCVIVINKWDLAQGKAGLDDYREYLEKTLPGLNYAPISMTCALDATNVNDTVRLAWNLYEQASIRLSTAKLNEVFEQIRQLKPPSAVKHKAYPKFYYATQTDINPPTIVMFVNNKEGFTEEYRRFITNRMRELLPFSEVPIKLSIRQRESKFKS